MPDTLTPQELAELDRRLEELVAVRLKAHIDALTAAVRDVRIEGAAYAEEDNYSGGVEACRAAVLIIFNG